jgi:hypothetical protein
MRFVQNGIRLPAGGKSAFVVRIALQQVMLDTLGGLVGDLRPARIVEEDDRTVKRGELVTDNGWIQGHGVLLGVNYILPKAECRRQTFFSGVQFPLKAGEDLMIPSVSVLDLLTTPTFTL